MIEALFPNVDWAKMWEATYDTLYMTAISTAAYLRSWYSDGIYVIFNKSTSNLGKQNC